MSNFTDYQDAEQTRRPVTESIILILAVYGTLYVVLYYFTLHPLENYSADIIYAVMRLMIAPLLLIAYARDLSFRRISSGFVIAMPSLLFAFYNVATGLESGFSVDEMSEGSYVVLMGLAPAILEEVLFRGIIIQMLIGSPKDEAERKEAERFAVSVSALLFALTHGAAYILNRTIETQLHVAILQMLFTLVLGINFGIVYVKTKDLPALIFVHATIDISAYLFNGSTFTDVTRNMFMAYIAASMTMTVLYAMWFTKQKQRDDPQIIKREKI